MLHLSGSGQTNSLAAVAGSHGSIDVAVTTIDDVLARETRVDVAKVDVEGAELLALGGMQETLRRQRDLALVVECNPTLLAGMRSSAGELLAWLEAEGFAVWQVDERAARLTPTVELGLGGYVNLACARGRQERIFAALERA